MIILGIITLVKYTLNPQWQATNNVTSGINTLGEVEFKGEEMRSTPEYVFKLVE